MPNNIVFRPGLYVGSEELNRFSDFMNQAYNDLFKSIVMVPGVSTTQSANSFRLVPSSSPNSVDINPGIAIDKDGNHLSSVSALNVLVPSDGLLYKVFVRARIDGYEINKVSVNSSGVVTSVGSKFTQIFRGLPTGATKIKFEGNQNQGVFTVEEVIDDETLQLVSRSTTVANNVQMAVVGTNSDNYLSAELYKITKIEAGVRLFLQDSEIEVGSVANNSGTISIFDTRKILKLI